MSFCAWSSCSACQALGARRPVTVLPRIGKGVDVELPDREDRREVIAVRASSSAPLGSSTVALKDGAAVPGAGHDPTRRRLLSGWRDRIITPLSPRKARSCLSIRRTAVAHVPERLRRELRDDTGVAALLLSVSEQERCDRRRHSSEEAHSSAGGSAVFVVRRRRRTEFLHAVDGVVHLIDDVVGSLFDFHLGTRHAHVGGGGYLSLLVGGIVERRVEVVHEERRVRIGCERRRLGASPCPPGSTPLGGRGCPTPRPRWRLQWADDVPPRMG